MAQRFDSRKQSILDFMHWHDNGELDLAPKFQRRSVWNPRAQSYLMDTIVRGKPIPKIYMRQEVNPKTRKTRREIVDGQQRIRTVLSYVADGFKISRVHNKDLSTKFFSELDDQTKTDILSYEFTVDLLQNMEDSDIYDIFARLNTYSVTLNAQELRHSRHFGDFRTSVSEIATEFSRFWSANHILTDKVILRMGDAEYVADLFIAMSVGIRAKERTIIDNYYRDWDETFPKRTIIEDRFREVIDIIGGIMEGNLATSGLSSTRLFYPFFCAIYHMQYGLMGFDYPHEKIKPQDYPKISSALTAIDDIIEKEKEKAEAKAEDTKIKLKDPLTAEEATFYKAYSEHWVHAEERKSLTAFIYNLMITALK
jgi:uncharacterized protein with ParB-like and HNH nuclease domain